MSGALLNERPLNGSNDCAQDRAGIFDQFTQPEHNELYYYAVYSSSDGEGNITVRDVTRLKFGVEVAFSPCTSGPEQLDHGGKVKEEVDADKYEHADDSKVDFKKRYGFRTRRLKDRLVEDFDTSLCESDADSHESEPDYAPSSDDEPYDLTHDDWTIVRGAKKKQNETCVKTRNTTMRKASERLMKKENGKHWKSKSLRNKPEPVTVKPEPSETAKTSNCKNETRRDASDHFRDGPRSKTRLTSVDVTFPASKSLHESKLSLNESAVPINALPKKSPNKIRFGYNITASKLPEIRSIKRRQLRQTAGRATGTTPITPREPSSSSEDETPISMKTRAGIKISRINHKEKQTSQSSKSIPPRPTKQPVKSEPHMANTATVKPGKGLKLVIRRQSVETNLSLVPSPLATTPESITNKDDIVVSAKKHNINMKKFAKKVPKDHVEKPPLVMKKSTDSNSSERNGSNESVDDECGDSRKEESTPSIRVAESGPTKNSNTASSKSQTAIDEEHSKKKKLKKKRKKERGRSASNASIEEACNAEYTAMRLAMELPRHNWLVKHLIKEKKLKAEDDKPLNTVRESDDTNGKTTQKVPDLKRRKSTGDAPSISHENISAHANLRKAESTSEGKNSNRQEEISNSDDLRNNQNNYLKGSSMVGIVKPFQHLNMSPATFKGGDASPPRLCIIDEDEHPNQGTDNVSKTCDEKQVDAALAAGDSDSIVARSSGTCSSVVVAAPATVAISYSTINTFLKDDSTKAPDIPAPTMSNSDVENHSTVQSIDMTKSSGGEEHPPVPHRNGADVECPKDLSVSDSNSVAVNSEKENTTDCSPEADSGSEIKISNCCSLALDLTIKDKVKSESVSCQANDDQPLDLSIKSKTGDTSPKVLDLSVKKQPQLTSPGDATVTNVEVGAKPKPCTSSQPVTANTTEYKKPAKSTPTHTPALQKEITKQDLRKTPVSVTLPPDLLSPQNKKEPVILIEDICKPPKNKASPHPNSSSENSLPKSMLTSPSSTKPSPSPMKRCASHDAAFAPMTGSPEQPKRARMSLDDSRLLSDKRNSASPSSNRSFMRKSVASPTKSSLEKIAGTLTSISNHSPTTATPPKLDKPFVISRENAPAVPVSANTSLFTSNPTEPRPSSSQVRIPIVRSNAHLPSYQTRCPPTSTINGSMTTSHKSSGVDHHPKIRTERSKSLQTNVRAHMVAQAYKPNINNLEPYIKAQQRAVDEKIKELEAIKRQLADASGNNKSKSQAQFTATSYARPPKQMRQHYNPPVRQLPIPIPKSTMPSSGHLTQNVMAQSHIPHHIPATMHTNQSRMPPHQLVAGPGMVHNMQQRPPPPRWRAMNPSQQEITPFVVRRPVTNGNRPMESLTARQMRPPHMLPSQNFPRLANPPPAMPVTPNQLPVPRAFSHPVPGSRMQSMPNPRLPLALPNAPVYRNGGLTPQLNEPIVIEDDITQQPNAHIHGPGFSPNSTHSLKIRRAHSYHPPLSKNQNRWAAPRPTLNVPGSQPSESKTESCARCRGKAFFLCSGCRKIWYCNKNCQLQDWNNHSAVCNG